MKSTNVRPSDLPEFETPPLVEVVLSVQFDSLLNFRAPMIGLLWSRFRDHFPIVQEHPPLDPALERFGIKKPRQTTPRIQIMENPPLSRCWFLSEAETELIQVQRDRFAHNWRKTGDADAYPRYESIRESFRSELEEFEDFIRHEKIGELIPNQCEITYVNHVLTGDAWSSHGELDKIVNFFDAGHMENFASRLEGVRTELRFVIPDAEGAPLGRLYIHVLPGYREKDDQVLFRLDLTARGRPMGEGLDGVFRFLDIGRECIVRAFAGVTTEKMHSVWRRMDA